MYVLKALKKRKTIKYLLKAGAGAGAHDKK